VIIWPRGVIAAIRGGGQGTRWGVSLEEKNLGIVTTPKLCSDHGTDRKVRRERKGRRGESARGKASILGLSK